MNVDPQLMPALAMTLVPNLPGDDLTVRGVRELDSQLSLPGPQSAEVESVQRPDGSLLEIRLHTAPSRQVILWIHGGGMFLGSARFDDAFCKELAETLGVCVASAEYRLAPEHPHPEPLGDCYLALEWLAERFDSLVVAGGSAGGGLAAGLALLARDRGGPEIDGLHLYYPMLDDRPLLPSRLEKETPVWDARLDALAWQAYLGGNPADAYAAPARALDLSGLPATFIDTGELDLFRDDIIAFAERLSAADVPVDFVLYPGAVHAFELIAPMADVSSAARARRAHSLSMLLEAGRSRKDTPVP